MVFPIAFSEIYALYGKTPKVKIPLKKAPLYPVILGVKVFCFCSPSFLKISLFRISNKNGSTKVSVNIKITG